MKTKKILIVVTSYGQIPNGTKTGIWLEEFTTPFYLFKKEGIQITVASPRGGKAPIDPKSLTSEYATVSVKKFMADSASQHILDNTVPLDNIKAENFEAMFYPGGHGPMWDLPQNKSSIRLIETFFAANKPVALVCHAPAVLKNVKADGSYLVEGKTVAGFTNSEEKAGQSTQMVPFSLEDMLKERGAKYKNGKDWEPFVVQDGNLFTGQNPASADLIAKKILEALYK